MINKFYAQVRRKGEERSGWCSGFLIICVQGGVSWGLRLPYEIPLLWKFHSILYQQGKGD